MKKIIIRMAVIKFTLFMLSMMYLSYIYNEISYKLKKMKKAEK
jgi:preprotein translocase subunit SecG